ncbi:KEOPS complex subunit Pcc1 [Halalkalicoccus jeotgali]|uniref:KEOPS complex Pcc1-like subunit n=1 Tax=Halalkalicoccus jeotgali (strain DSM 18796 / CECT 7217 / JCM 14584 / KCTC 4019 / B3) TaxID=795797 RepID=D8J6Z9_HALJB|nr:KEOPS complex subunit Pcc1 [Halalkalicoccus jeotgali]ADJ15952.1 rpo operon protein [Halalkalicoccus jeotgali B3]ELY38048.1 KEOPS complex Pcc1-like subunit [Halalkalicoccus jeotgali B3]
MTAHDAFLTTEYNDQHRARLIERSLRPELADLADERSWTDVSRSGATLSIRIEATDLVALRAAANTWLTLLDVAERSAQAGDLVET